ncbi:MAG: hypothetical protein H0S80_00100 [Desulfovibrionaceae bacterium]|nr:hypothetical protein [Desulfovibrionaceae bacterium]
MSIAGLVKFLKPVGAGLALAYLATGLLDGPAPVNFQPENPYTARQTEIMEPHASVVVKKNIMKLGSLLSVPEGDIVLPRAPLADGDEIEVLPRMDSLPGAPGPEVKGEVAEPPEP